MEVLNASYNFGKKKLRSRSEKLAKRTSSSSVDVPAAHWHLACVFPEAGALCENNKKLREHTHTQSAIPERPDTHPHEQPPNTRAHPHTQAHTEARGRFAKGQVQSILFLPVFAAIKDGVCVIITRFVPGCE